MCAIRHDFLVGLSIRKGDAGCTVEINGIESVEDGQRAVEVTTLLASELQDVCRTCIQH